jgi:PHD/YefM family antitoxin component YafN of YafNO toxin-antitoxin module
MIMVLSLPNFVRTIAKSQLKQYLLNNRDDQEALRELKSRPKHNVITISANTNAEEQERILKRAISNLKSN